VTGHPAGTGRLIEADRLRIAFVYDALYPFATGGAERRYHEIAARLATRHEVHTVSWQYGVGSPVAGVDEITHHGVGSPPSFYGADGRRTVREAMSFAWRVIPHLLAHRYDVIDCSATPYVPVYGVWLAARATRTPLVVTWHEVWGDYWNVYLDDRPMVARMARTAEAWTRPLGDVAVAVSSFTAARLAALGGGPEIRVVPNGVSLAEIDAVPPATTPTDMIFVGRLIADKKVGDLIQAVALLRHERPSVSCTVVGEGPERSRLEDLARSLGLEHNVTFTGRLDASELMGRLKAARLLAMPSVREGYGLTVVEAMAAGAVPVVVRAPMSAAADLVTDGVDGLVCEPGATALAESIGRLLADDEARTRIKVAARKSAEAWDWALSADGAERVYREAIISRHGIQRRPRVSCT
jgi:glycosyltransferase involved in cell wall biosynthesis